MLGKWHTRITKQQIKMIFLLCAVKLIMVSTY